MNVRFKNLGSILSKEWERYDILTEREMSERSWAKRSSSEMLTASSSRLEQQLLG